MASIQDERGFNQGFRPTKALEIRTKRRAEMLMSNVTSGESSAIDILEIGSGMGELAFYLSEKKNYRVTGSDLSHMFVSLASNQYQRNNLEYVALDFNDTNAIKEFTGGKLFDVVCGNGILHHLFKNMDSSLIQIKSILKENGKISFMEPNIYNPYCFLIFKISLLRKIAKLEPDEMAFSKDYITKKLESTGYKNIKVEYRDFLLPNTPEIFIKPVVRIGSILEKLNLTRWLSQSLLITAEK